MKSNINYLLMKKVLLFTPAFYQYGALIENAMKKEGIYVRSFFYCSNWLYKIGVLFGATHLTNYLKKLFFNKTAKQLFGKEELFDEVVVIRGSEIPDTFYRLLKDKYNKARFILYLWDEIHLDPEEKNILHYFDKVMSFSKRDCALYGFEFRPMFIDNSVNTEDEPRIYDILMIASYKPSRFEFLKRLLLEKRINNYKIKVILRCSLFTFLRNPEHFKYYRYFRIFSVKYSEMISLLKRTKACIELPNPGQNAITTRPVEAMYTKTKLITSSSSINTYDFYNSENILIIDENNPKISRSWLDSDFVSIPDAIMRNYYLTSFINEIIS